MSHPLSLSTPHRTSNSPIRTNRNFTLLITRLYSRLSKLFDILEFFLDLVHRSICLKPGTFCFFYCDRGISTFDVRLTFSDIAISWFHCFYFFLRCDDSMFLNRIWRSSHLVACWIWSFWSSESCRDRRLLLFDSLVIENHVKFAIASFSLCALWSFWWFCFFW